ncbi:MAG: alkaline phosphatase family protein [Bacteroidetes bacterium HGW-Bacteroidetes-1]|jgi:alkaline phosphatase D|nr:MAG: alkaline phosphatase family protein [Bacteroidetes bacterium HGW-Bacteroidetes-1]
MIQKIILAIWLLIALTSCRNTEKKVENHQLVILSMDGFRWDYTDRTNTPNLDKIARNGVKAERMIPSFPSTTFANHYTIATGLYPDHHGILVNRFYAPDLDAYYNDRGNRASVEDGKFYGGEPIWVTAEYQQVKTATFYWVGSESDVMGKRPTYWKRYEHDLPYSQRIDTVIYWLGLPEAQRPQLVMWYFDEPDSSGHDFGPENDSILPLITRLDSLVGVFLAKMEALPNAENINFIIVSDHGMAQLSPDRQILLDQYVDTSMLAIIDGWNPTMNLKVKEGHLDQVYESLQKVENLQVWKHGEAPAYLHHGTHIRTHDITILADDGWSIYWSWTKGDANGTHGYDIRNTDVNAIFYAIGPDFKSNYTKKPFQNIHIYPLLAHLLQLQPAKVDGNLDSIRDILKNVN